MADKFVKFSQDLINTPDTNLGAELRQTKANVDEAQIASRSRQRAQESAKRQASIQGATSILTAVGKINLIQRQLNVTKAGEKEHKEYFQEINKLSPEDRLEKLQNLMEDNTLWKSYKQKMKASNIPDHVAQPLLKAYSGRLRSQVSKQLSKDVITVNNQNKQLLAKVKNDIRLEAAHFPGKDFRDSDAWTNNYDKIVAMSDGNQIAAANSLESSGYVGLVEGLLKQGDKDKASAILGNLEVRKLIGPKEAKRLDSSLSKIEKSGTTKLEYQAATLSTILNSPSNQQGNLAEFATTQDLNTVMLRIVKYVEGIPSRIATGKVNPPKQKKILNEYLSKNLRGKIKDKAYFRTASALAGFIDKAHTEWTTDYASFHRMYIGGKTPGGIQMTNRETKAFDKQMLEVANGKRKIEAVHIPQGVTKNEAFTQWFYLKKGTGTSEQRAARDLAYMTATTFGSYYTAPIRDAIQDPGKSTMIKRSLKIGAGFDTRQGRRQFLELTPEQQAASSVSFNNDPDMLHTAIFALASIETQDNLEVIAGEDPVKYNARFNAEMKKQAVAVAARIADESLAKYKPTKESILKTSLTQVPKR